MKEIIFLLFVGLFFISGCDYSPSEINPAFKMNCEEVGGAGNGGMVRCENNEAICYVKYGFHSSPYCFRKEDK